MFFKSQNAIVENKPKGKIWAKGAVAKQQAQTVDHPADVWSQPAMPSVMFPTQTTKQSQGLSFLPMAKEQAPMVKTPEKISTPAANRNVQKIRFDDLDMGLSKNYYLDKVAS